MVTDTGGIDDRSFNASAWAGMQAANKAGKAKVRYVQSKSESDYAPNISQLVSQKCNLVVTVGGLMGQATTDASKKTPNQHFAIVDSNGNGTNVQGLQFNTAQAGFLAGYLAAGYSKTGKVATYGGLKIPPVTIYMDGFWEGVQYFNSKKGKNVQVLGWSEKAQNGSFAGSFTDQSQGQQLANNFIQQGADVIFPVAGGTGLGSAGAAQASGGKAVIIWVDSDGVVSAPQYSSVFLSTAFKNVDNAVQKAVTDSSGGTFATSDYIGTLANGGVGLSPFHDFDSKVDPALKSELDQIKQDIISGTIKITSPSQPKG
ncbi:MAG TPA: BMP family ABC transporter substrate-binding protein [Pseudonocardiaceae bacterium]|nr:BMP family ABC transporter substrate-binding protein [Pseudonocardiaceae bacterium]